MMRLLAWPLRVVLKALLPCILNLSSNHFCMTSHVPEQMYNDLARRAFPGSPVACARFRKELLAPLRSRLGLVESHMSAREFNSINYEAVPSKAMAK